ncbi:ABC transporter permease [Metamycoplasma arthritidis]|nr:ABC transporter permease [Metamycoplasma arthritidis]
MKIVNKSLGSYLMPGIILLFVLILGIGLSVIFSSLASNSKVELSLLNILVTIISSIGIMALLAVVIYFIHLVYYNDRSDGIEMISYSKPLSRGQIFFGNFFAILIPSLATTVVYWIIGTTILFIFFNKADVSNINLLFKGSGIILFINLLGTMLLISMGLFIAPKINHKAFGITMSIPLAYGGLIVAANAQEASSIQRHFAKNYVENNARKNHILNTSNKSPLDFNGEQIDSFLKKRSKNSASLTFDAYDLEKMESFIESQKKIITSFFRWTSLLANNNDMISHMLGLQYGANTRVAWAKEKLNKNNYLNLKSNDGRDYSLIQTGANSQATFKAMIASYQSKVKDGLINLQRAINSATDANEKAALLKQKEQHQKLLNILEKTTKYSDIFNLEEFKNLVSNSYSQIESKLSASERDGNFLITHEAIIKKILVDMYKDKEAFFSTLISKNSLATYLTAHYYREKGLVIKDLKSLSDKNVNQEQNIQNLRKLAQIYGSIVQDNNSIIKYEFLESDFAGIKSLRFANYTPTFIAFALPIVATILLLIGAYFIHKRKAFK